MDDSEAESAEREESYLVNVERGGLKYLEIPPEKVRKIRNEFYKHFLIVKLCSKGSFHN